MTIEITPYIFSPIHIGTGNDLDPFSYVLRKNGEIFEMCRYDLLKLLKLADGKDFAKIQELSLKPSKWNFLEIRRTVGAVLSKYENAITEKKEIPYTDFIEKYDESIKSGLPNQNQDINMLNISETYRDGGKLTIPGSSLKGAIRTAILQEAGVFDNIPINEDPFKMLSVDDIHFNEQKISLGYYLNYKIDNISEPKSKRLTQASEVIKQGQSGLRFKITVKKYLKNKDDILNQTILRLDKFELFKIINKHYLDLFEYDYSLFKKYAPNGWFVKKVDEKLLNSCNESRRAFIKVGFHSGALGVTYKPKPPQFNNRKIQIKQREGPPIEANEPTTMWHFSLKNGENTKPNDLYPSGWLLLT
jgi:CRISPR-associated protein Csm5